MTPIHRAAAPVRMPAAGQACVAPDKARPQKTPDSSELFARLWQIRGEGKLIDGQLREPRSGVDITALERRRQALHNEAEVISRQLSLLLDD